MTRAFVVVEEESPFGTVRSTKEVSVPLLDLGVVRGALLMQAFDDARQETREMVAARVNAGPKGPLP